MQHSEMPDGIGGFGRAKMILPGKHLSSFRSPVGIAGQSRLPISLFLLSHHFVLLSLLS